MSCSASCSCALRLRLAPTSDYLTRLVEQLGACARIDVFEIDRLGDDLDEIVYRYRVAIGATEWAPELVPAGRFVFGEE